MSVTLAALETKDIKRSVFVKYGMIMLLIRGHRNHNIHPKYQKCNGSPRTK